MGRRAGTATAANATHSGVSAQFDANVAITRAHCRFFYLVCVCAASPTARSFAANVVAVHLPHVPHWHWHGDDDHSTTTDVPTACAASCCASLRHLTVSCIPYRRLHQLRTVGGPRQISQLHCSDTETSSTTVMLMDGQARGESEVELSWEQRRRCVAPTRYGRRRPRAWLWLLLAFCLFQLLLGDDGTQSVRASLAGLFLVARKKS
jgi:uncharacterized MAPEG superfamily protein